MLLLLGVSSNGPATLLAKVLLQQSPAYSQEDQRLDVIQPAVNGLPAITGGLRLSPLEPVCTHKQPSGQRRQL